LAPNSRAFGPEWFIRAGRRSQSDQTLYNFSKYLAIELASKKDVGMRHWFLAQGDDDRGNFRAANDELLALFGDPDVRGARSWRETFGYERARRRPEPRPLLFSARATPKSSSDW
jgi:hypothetical protein